MKVIRWFVDCYLNFGIWLARRREMHEAREDRFDRERKSLQRDNDDLRGQLAIAQRHAEFVTKINARHVAMIEAEIALSVRLKADAIGTTPQSNQ